MKYHVTRNNKHVSFCFFAARKTDIIRVTELILDAINSGDFEAYTYVYQSLILVLFSHSLINRRWGESIHNLFSIFLWRCRILVYWIVSLGDRHNRASVSCSGHNIHVCRCLELTLQLCRMGIFSVYQQLILNGIFDGTVAHNSTTLHFRGVIENKIIRE